MIGASSRLQQRRAAEAVANATQRAQDRESRQVERLLQAQADAMRQPRPTAVMQAVSKVVAARPKAPRLKNRALLDLAQGQVCLLQSPLCNRDSQTTVACHGAGIANGKGLGYKVSDIFTVWGCSACNNYTDAFNGATAEEKLAVFLAGHARQVIAWRQIATTATKPAARRTAQWALDRLKEHEETIHVV